MVDIGIVLDLVTWWVLRGYTQIGISVALLFSSLLRSFHLPDKINKNNKNPSFQTIGHYTYSYLLIVNANFYSVNRDSGSVHMVIGNPLMASINNLLDCLYAGTTRVESKKSSLFRVRVNLE